MRSNRDSNTLIFSKEEIIDKKRITTFLKNNNVQFSPTQNYYQDYEAAIHVTKLPRTQREEVLLIMQDEECVDKINNLWSLMPESNREKSSSRSPSKRNRSTSAKKNSSAKKSPKLKKFNKLNENKIVMGITDDSGEEGVEAGREEEASQGQYLSKNLSKYSLKSSASKKQYNEDYSFNQHSERNLTSGRILSVRGRSGVETERRVNTSPVRSNSRGEDKMSVKCPEIRIQGNINQTPTKGRLQTFENQQTFKPSSTIQSSRDLHYINAINQDLATRLNSEPVPTQEKLERSLLDKELNGRSHFNIRQAKMNSESQREYEGDHVLEESGMRLSVDKEENIVNKLKEMIMDDAVLKDLMSSVSGNGDNESQIVDYILTKIIQKEAQSQNNQPQNDLKKFETSKFCGEDILRPESLPKSFESSKSGRNSGQKKNSKAKKDQAKAKKSPKKNTTISEQIFALQNMSRGDERGADKDSSLELNTSKKDKALNQASEIFISKSKLDETDVEDLSHGGHKENDQNLSFSRAVFETDGNLHTDEDQPQPDQSKQKLRQDRFHTESDQQGEESYLKEHKDDQNIMITEGQESGHEGESYGEYMGKENTRAGRLENKIYSENFEVMKRINEIVHKNTSRKLSRSPDKSVSRSIEEIYTRRNLDCFVNPYEVEKVKTERRVLAREAYNELSRRVFHETSSRLNQMDQKISQNTTLNEAPTQRVFENRSTGDTMKLLKQIVAKRKIEEIGRTRKKPYGDG